MSEDELFEIAKIIDNEFIGTRRTFSAKQFKNYWYLSTNKCDEASFIKVWDTNNKISSILRLGPDTESWDELHPGTWARIEKYLSTLNPLTNGQ